MIRSFVGRKTQQRLEMTTYQLAWSDWASNYDVVILLARDSTDNFRGSLRGRGMRQQRHNQLRGMCIAEYKRERSQEKDQLQQDFLLPAKQRLIFGFGLVEMLGQ